MRLLFVATRFPYPPRYGDQVRGFHHLRILSLRHQIVLLSPRPDSSQDANALKALEPFCEETHLLSVPVWRRLLHLVKVPFTSIPLQTLYLYDDCFRAKAQELMRSQSFDLIHVQTIRMAPIINELSPRVPAVLDLIDALSVNMAQRAQWRLSPQTLVAGWESRRLQYYERELVKRYNQLVISSQKDRMAIGDISNIHVVPNGVDLEAFPLNTGEREPATIVFTGSMWYSPNVEAVVWFVKNIFPLVRQQLPEAKFNIVGGRPAPAVRRLAMVPGVAVTGYVTRIQDYLSRAAVAVAPMQSGTGMQFKVIEAMACGTPVVVTPYALGGLEVTNEKQLLVAYDGRTFAECILRLISDLQLRNRLVQNALKLIEKRYTWERSVEVLESVYRLAIENHQVRRGNNE